MTYAGKPNIFFLPPTLGDLSRRPNDVKKKTHHRHRQLKKKTHHLCDIGMLSCV
ncbi:unnamed protein product [Prunus brigantina]